MDAIQLQKNLEFVRPDTDWEVAGGAMPAGVAASVNVNTGLCNVAGGRIFGDSHVAIHEILHAKGALKEDQSTYLKNHFAGKFESRKVAAMLWLLEELRVECLVRKKDYAMSADRCKNADNLLAVAIAEIWSLKIDTAFSLRRRAVRLAKLVLSYDPLPTTPNQVADWMKKVLPKAFRALELRFWERFFLRITELWSRFINWLRRLWQRPKSRLVKPISLDHKPILSQPDPLHDILDALERQKKEQENAVEIIKMKENRETPSTRKMKYALLERSNPYKDMTLILPPAHSPCPPRAFEIEIPHYITNAMLSGLRNKEKRYARSGRRLVVSRLLANSPPFAKHFFRTQKILILLDFSGSMERWLYPMLDVVARLSANTDFDVMAYSANRDSFLLHLIYSDKYFSHAVHYRDGNADCAAFFIAKHLQADYDKVVIIGDMYFAGPAPVSSADLDQKSLMELRDLLKGNRSLILTPGGERYANLLSNKFKISSQYLRGFKDEKEFQEILESAIRET